MASQLGLDTAAFSQCLASNTYAQQVQADYNRAVSLNIQSTPTFVINGQLYPGIQQVEDFSASLPLSRRMSRLVRNSLPC